MSCTVNLLRWTAIIAALPGLCNIAAGQAPAAPQDTPVDVVKRFWKEEVKGKRLTAEGWRELSSACLRSMPFPGRLKIHVISRDSPVKESGQFRSPEHARVVGEYWRYGDIDPMLRFVRAPQLSPEGVRIGGTVSPFELALTEELDPHGKATGRKVWRILEAPLWVTVEVPAAMDYVRRIRDTTKDPALKRNANKTLAVLTMFDKEDAAAIEHAKQRAKEMKK